ncbi:MAG: sigma-70 family RNA polymerase sigma factor [Planctomycetes bacterium]|nr:sigma-70 family RNA polymerase sigma factor [Planctomycetota bacterium]
MTQPDSSSAAMPPSSSSGTPKSALEAHVAEVMPELYNQLREIAARYMNRERRDHSMQATEVVHEAFVRLAGWEKAIRVNDREQFLAAAAAVIRRVLVDHARRRNAMKRGGGEVGRLGDFDAPAPEEPGPATVAELIEIDGAIERLRQLNERSARIVELRFFGGLTIDQIARVLSVSPRTVHEDWRFARAWLRHELGEALGDHDRD